MLGLSRTRAENPRSKWEEELERFKRLADTANDALCVLDEDSRFIYANRSACRMFGLPEYKLGQLRATDAGLGMDETQFRNLFRRSREEVILPFETEVKRADGTVLPIEVSLSYVTIGEKGYLFSVSRDITCRRKAEEALRRSEQFSQGIIQSSHDCLMVLDAEGRIVFLNPASKALLGISDFRSLLNRYWAELWSGAQREKAVSALKSAMGGELTQYQGSFAAPGGVMKHWDVLVTPMTDDENRVERILVVARDISALKTSEDQLRHTADELGRSNRDLSDFASIASHDLQEPLRAITSYLGLVKRRYLKSMEPAAASYVDSALEGARRMRDLIEGLLSYSRVGSRGEEPKLISLDEAVNRAVGNLRVVLQETSTTLMRDKLPFVNADPIQLEQLFQNLIGNAVKFRQSRPPVIQLTCSEKGSEWIFAVQDNGVGFEMRDADKVFEVFRRLHCKSKFTGSGIGLAVCKRIVERHGGKIWVDWAEVGQGTRICFTLPKPVSLRERAERQRLCA